MNFREYLSEGTVSPKTIKQVAELTSNNQHTDARMLIAKVVLNDGKMYAKLKRIKMESEQEGSTSMANIKLRSEIESEMMPALHKNLKKSDFNKLIASL